MFDVEIITPAKLVFQDRASSLVAPGAGGLFGILSNHAPLFNTLQVGHILVELESGKQVSFAVGGGFLELADGKVVVLADSAENESLVNVERAEAAKKRAQARLDPKSNNKIDTLRAELALRRAINRIKLSRA